MFQGRLTADGLAAIVSAMPVKIFLMIGFLLLSTGVTGAQQRPTHGVTLSRGQVRQAEQHLSDLGYWTGSVDGIFDPATSTALTAFQKWEGRRATGKLTVDELEAISKSAAPTARELGYAHVEVDVDRQVLLIVNGEGSVKVLPVSTGNDKPFESEGQTSIAYTPRGRFLVYDKEAGWGSGPLGSMYYSNFISGGVAIHGSPNVPARPASHGCIRVPMFAARELSKLLPVGTIVLVYDKVSFVSAKDWVKNPKLKEAALLASASEDYTYETDRTRTKSRTVVIRKARPRINRAGLLNNLRQDILDFAIPEQREETRYRFDKLV